MTKTIAEKIIDRCYHNGVCNVAKANGYLRRLGGEPDRLHDDHARFVFADGSALWSSWSCGDLWSDEDFEEEQAVGEWFGELMRGRGRN